MTNSAKKKFVTHYFLHRENEWGGYNTSTLCGRSSSACDDGFNSTDESEEVTCKICLKQMEARGLLPAGRP